MVHGSNPTGTRMVGLAHKLVIGVGRRLKVLLGIAGLLSAGPALACSVCGCGDPLLTSSDPSAISGALRLQFDVEYLRIGMRSQGSGSSRGARSPSTRICSASRT
jgi:hypothetical protein